MKIKMISGTTGRTLCEDMTREDVEAHRSVYAIGGRSWEIFSSDDNEIHALLDENSYVVLVYHIES